MKKYEMFVDKIKKILSIRIWGMFEPEDANSFVEDLMKTVSLLQASEFTLSFDAEELKVSKQEMVPMLEGCFKMYKEIGFNRVIANLGNSAILKSQISRVARNAGLSIEIV
jgi:hypothetical protein